MLGPGRRTRLVQVLAEPELEGLVSRRWREAGRGRRRVQLRQVNHNVSTIVRPPKPTIQLNIHSVTLTPYSFFSLLSLPRSSSTSSPLLRFSSLSSPIRTNPSPRAMLL